MEDSLNKCLEHEPIEYLDHDEDALDFFNDRHYKFIIYISFH
jgi:hypothetical protein